MLAVACTRTEPRSAAVPSTREWENPTSGKTALFAFASAEGAHCALLGRVVLDAEIHFGSDAYEPIADLWAREVGVEVLALAPRGSARSKIRVRSVPSGPGIVVDGWIDNRALPLRLLRQVDVSPGHVWFENRSVVQALAGNGTRVRVTAESRCTSNFGVAADVDCSELSLYDRNTDLPEPRAPSASGKRFEPLVPKGLPLALFDDAGQRVFELGYGELGAERNSGPLTRVHLARRGFDIRGWVETSALETPPDRSDHCMEPRDVIDKCPFDPEDPLPAEDSDGCNEVAWEIRDAVREIPLRLEPKVDAKVVGFVERGARIRVPRSGVRFITVEDERSGLAAPYRAPFWAQASDVR